MSENTIGHVIEWANRSEWLTEPQQSRSRASLIRIIDAAVTLFCAKGYGATSIIDISKASNVSVGSIYNRFGDKISILFAVIDSYYRTRTIQYDDIIAKGRSTDTSPAEALRIYLNVMFSGFRQDHALICFVERQRLADRHVAGQAEDLQRHVAEGLASLLEPHAKTLSIGDIKVKSFALHRIVYSTLALQSMHFAQDLGDTFENYITPVEEDLEELAKKFLKIDINT